MSPPTPKAMLLSFNDLFKENIVYRMLYEIYALSSLFYSYIRSNLS